MIVFILQSLSFIGSDLFVFQGEDQICTNITVYSFCYFGSVKNVSFQYLRQEQVED